MVITVIAGALNISANEDKQQRVYVRTIHVHPKYKRYVLLSYVVQKPYLVFHEIIVYNVFSAGTRQVRMTLQF